MLLLFVVVVVAAGTKMLNLKISVAMARKKLSSDGKKEISWKFFVQCLIEASQK